MAFKGRAAVVCAFSVLLLSGCFAGKEQIDRAEIDRGLKINRQYADAPAVYDAVYDRWWLELDSTELNLMMDRMFSDNYKIAQSYEGLKALYAAYGVSDSDRAFTLSGKASASGSISESSGNGVSRDSYFLGLTASYEADIWGRLKNASRANLFSLMSGRYDLEALYMTLSGELAQKYITCISLKNILDVKKDGLKLYQARLDARERLYKAGVGDITKVLEAKKGLETVQTDILTSEKAYRDVKQALALLLGHADGGQIEISGIYRLPELPRALPAETAAQRPDIKAALYEVYKYDRTAAAATAGKYPSLSFSAEAGYTDGSVGSILSPENFAAQIIAGLVMPILDGKGREFEAQKQKAYLKQSIYAYQETVINALSEVQTALTADKYAEETLKKQNKRLDSDIKLYRLAKMRYEQGVDTYEAVLETKIALNERLSAVLSAKKDLGLARIDVITAVGGSWAAGYTAERLSSDIQKVVQEQK